MSISVRRTSTKFPYLDKDIADNLRPWADDMCSDHGQVLLGFPYRQGQGETRFTVRIRGASFQELATAMMKADQEAAIKAFGTALQDFEIKKAESKAAA